MKQFLTINAAAKELGLAHNYLRALLANGKLPGVYSGTRFYVNTTVLLEQLDKESRSRSSLGE